MSSPGDEKSDQEFLVHRVSSAKGKTMITAIRFAIA
jgi:hypothetical protein